MTRSYYTPKKKAYDVAMTVEFLPYPSEIKRKEAYETQAKLYLRAKERMLKQKQQKIKRTELSDLVDGGGRRKAPGSFSY